MSRDAYRGGQLPDVMPPPPTTPGPTRWPIAFSFAEWRCADPKCRQIVQWADAIWVEYDGKLGGFRHVDCEAPE